MVAWTRARRQRSAIEAAIATHLKEIPNALSALHEALRIDRAGIRARGGGLYLQRLNPHKMLSQGCSVTTRRAALRAHGKESARRSRPGTAGR